VSLPKEFANSRNSMQQDLLLYWAQMMQEGEIARDVASRFDSRIC
jgi:hypothetical protein